jgi:hypothetical protein
MKLREAMVGCKFDIGRKSVERVLKDSNSQIKAFKSRPSFTRYRIDKNMNAKLWQ